MENVRHNVAESRFEIGDAAAGNLALVDYRMTDGQMIITHTFVPPQFRGQGIAEQLVTAALDFARGEGRLVVPRCSYVDTFLRRHPAFADLRATSR